MGPLSGVRIVELAGLGPAPFCGMMLADHGAEVVRIDRVGEGFGLAGDPARDVLCRSRKALRVNLKSAQGVALLRRLCKSADGLIEGFRPGVMERLGLGPGVLLEDNPKLVYGRVTGWGQDGPYAQMAGHDINFVALSGALHACGPAGARPVPPLNLVGDFGGGGMLLAFGMVAALLHARSSGKGQVIDCALTEGSALLMSMMYSLRASGRWIDRRGVNMLDSGAHYYNTYATSDGKYIAIGAVEPQFYAQLLELVGLAEDERFQSQNDSSRWPQLHDELARVFRTRTREQWCAILERTDVCFAPVMSMSEAPAHPHNIARGAFITVDGIVQPAPAPRYSQTPLATPATIGTGDAVTAEILGPLGYSELEIGELKAAGVID